MKRIIKEYWPLLLIAGWLLWRKRHRNKMYYSTSKPTMPLGENTTNSDIIPTVTYGDWVKTEEICPSCGRVFYKKVLSDGTVIRACSNTNCRNGNEELYTLMQIAHNYPLY